jgi:hypothetical protein
MARVVAEREGSAVRLADASLRAEDQDLGAPELVGPPAHADVLRPSEQIAAWFPEQIRGRNRQRSLRSGGGGDNLQVGRVIGIEDWVHA